MSHSVRLTLRLGHECDLSVQEIPEARCRLDIKPDPAGDDRIIVDLTIHGRTEPHHAEREVDDAINGSATEEKVAEDDGDVVGVGKLQEAILGGHRQSFQNLVDMSKLQQGFNQSYCQPLNQAYPKAKESSGGDK